MSNEEIKRGPSPWNEEFYTSNIVFIPNDGIEQSGVKGMKWGKKKAMKKANEACRNASSGDISGYAFALMQNDKPMTAAISFINNNPLYSSADPTAKDELANKIYEEILRKRAGSDPEKKAANDKRVADQKRFKGTKASAGSAAANKKSAAAAQKKRYSKAKDRM